MSELEDLPEPMRNAVDKLRLYNDKTLLGKSVDVVEAESSASQSSLLALWNHLETSRCFDDRGSLDENKG